jgi:cell division septal protein FtsQ
MARKKKRGPAVGGLFKKLVVNRFILTAFLCAIVLGGVFYGLRHFFQNTRFFDVSEIVVSKEGGYAFWEGEDKIKNLYLGRNIFNVNPENLEILIKEDAPQLKTVVVRRVMPNRLEIDVVPREPAAFINAGRGFVIDKEAVVLSRGKSEKNLVEIKGMRFFFSAPARGERVENAMLDKALTLLEELREKRVLSEYRAESINISDKNNIQLEILGVVVKMGSSDFPKKIMKLKEIFEDPDVNVEDIEYIDLRFDSPIISPR